MGLGDVFRNILDIPKVTDDGFKYQVVKDEIKIVGYKKNSSFNKIPSYIEELPVGIISGLQSIPFSGELYIPNTVHTITDLALNIAKNITKIIVPESVKNIGHHVFDFNDSLVEIIFADNIDLSESEGSVSNCEKLKYIHLPLSMTKIPICFLSDCISLEEINIPDSVTIIDDCAFSYCEGLKTVHLPKSLKRLNEMAFSDCKSLETIQLPDGLEYIGNRAFSGCENLKNINIPSTVKKIDKYAFEMCEKLVKPDIPSNCEVHEKAFK